MQKRTADALIDDLINEMSTNLQILLSLAYSSRAQLAADVATLIEHYSSCAGGIRSNFPITRKKLGQLSREFMLIRRAHVRPYDASLTPLPLDQRQYFG